MPAYLHKANGGKALHEDYIFSLTWISWLIQFLQ